MMVRVQHGMRMIAAAGAALALLSGCSSTGGPIDKSNHAPALRAATPAEGASAPVVTGTCPQVSLRDGTSFLRKYAQGAKEDPTKLVYQASLAETTRQCTVTNGVMSMTVMAQGRLVLGPAGKPGSFTLPIRVAVIDGEKTVYSQLVKFNAELGAGQASGQFLFSKNDVTVEGPVSATTRIFLGFDEGPYNTN